jgi:uroporphyrinogen decarboxylase
LEERVSGNLLAVLEGMCRSPPPVWLMRQAGRYLPEYREARARAGSFWRLCMTPAAAAEVTVQPVQRFDVDAAILFSDILVVPYALGKRVEFEDGVGPRIETTVSSDELCRDTSLWRERLAPVYEAIDLVGARLPRDKDLIGFARGAWTLASYMVHGYGSADQAAAKLWAYRDPEGFRELLWVISDCVAAHLCAQIKAGATVVQLFDSWAGGLSQDLFRQCVIAPTRYIVEQVRNRIPGAKIIGFPRGATQAGYAEYLASSAIDAISLDTAVSMEWAAQSLGRTTALQGNLDPLALVAGGEAMRSAVDHLLEAMRERPFIANLGHGVLPETPVEHVVEFVRCVRRTR